MNVSKKKFLISAIAHEKKTQMNIRLMSIISEENIQRHDDVIEKITYPIIIYNCNGSIAINSHRYLKSTTNKQEISEKELDVLEKYLSIPFDFEYPDLYYKYCMENKKENELETLIFSKLDNVESLSEEEMCFLYDNVLKTNDEVYKEHNIKVFDKLFKIFKEYRYTGYYKYRYHKIMRKYSKE